jgi:hypothetical protein
MGSAKSPQPPNPVKRSKTDIPTLLSADILALRLHHGFARQTLWKKSANGRSPAQEGKLPPPGLDLYCPRKRTSVAQEVSPLWAR